VTASKSGKTPIDVNSRIGNPETAVFPLAGSISEWPVIHPKSV
jgi:hypothetical protein